MKTSGIAVRGISATVPTLREDNLELDFLDKAQRQKLVDTTGIRYRHLADQQRTSELFEHAATRLLKTMNWSGDDVQLLVVVTQTPDQVLPGLASQLQHRLGLAKNTLVLDLNQGCAGYVYGLSVASGMMQSLGLARGLLLVGDTITQHISKDNHSLRPIFSDAGTATALEQKEGAAMQFAFGVDGEHHDTICLPTGSNELQMNGHRVFSFGLSTVAKGLKKLLTEYGEPQDIDFLVMHQANKLLNDAIAKKLGIPEARVPSSHHDFGNTSSATIPLTLCAQLNASNFKEEKTVMLAGFGVGLTWGGVIFSLKDLCLCPISKV